MTLIGSRSQGDRKCRADETESCPPRETCLRPVPCSRLVQQSHRSMRNSEYRNASQENKAVFKGAKYLLLKNRSHLRRKKDRQQLEELLKLNQVINSVLILKEKLKHIWSYRSRTWANKTLDEWCALARALNHRAVSKFAQTLERYRYGILNHCEYSIYTESWKESITGSKSLNEKHMAFMISATFPLKSFKLSPTKLEKNHIS